MHGRSLVKHMKLGRNDLCSCGSGKKFKKCCLNKVESLELKIENLRKKGSFKVLITTDNCLYDLHRKILEGNKWSPEHSFSFFMSDKFWDSENEYAGNVWEAGTSKVLLKNLNLKTGDTFLYLYDYGSENPFKISVLSVS